MTEFPRSFFKTDPVFSKIHAIIKQNHKVADHTARTLFRNRHTKDFCETARHFVVLGESNPIYASYDVSSWWKEPGGVLVTIDTICVYDNALEYESARMHRVNKN